jgi:hypothetical protein
MLAQEMLGSNQPVETPAEAWLNKGLHRAIRGRITPAFLDHAEPREDPHAIGLQAKHGVAARQKQDLFRAWLTDAGKTHQRLFGLRQRQTANGFKAAAELVDHQSGDLPQLVNLVRYQNPMGSHRSEIVVARGENLLRLGADRRLQGPKGLPTPFVICEVGDVFEQDQLERCAVRRSTWLAKYARQRLDYLFKR